MERLNIDLTSFSAAQTTIEEAFQLSERQHLMEDYFIARDRAEVTKDSFMEFIKVTHDPFEGKEIYLSSLHVTTNNDSCESLRKLGLLDLQRVVVEDTPLKRFLETHGIFIYPDRGELFHNGSIYKLSPKPSRELGDYENDLLRHVSFKLYKDHPVCGFVCSRDVLGYGGQVNRRPEILNNIANLLRNPLLVSQWEKMTTTYILKFSLPIHKYESISSSNAWGDLILRTMYDYIYYGGPVCDVYSFLRPGDRVQPQEILNFFTVDEFMQYLDH